MNGGQRMRCKALQVESDNFQRVIKIVFYDTATKAVEIQGGFCRRRGFPVPYVVFTKECKPS